MMQGFRLSPQQQHLWESSQESPAYRVQALLSISGELRDEQVARALQAVIEQHEILRTTFHYSPELGMAVQVIGEEARVDWHTLNLRDLDAQSQAARIDAVLTADVARPFDLQHGPPLRALLLQLAEREHLLLLALPTLCADGWTIERLAEKLSAAYAATITGADTEQEELLQYADFAEWQHDLLTSEDARDGRGFWRAATSNIPALRLPFQQEADDTTFAPVSYEVIVEPAVVERLDQLARTSNTSLAVVLLACWQVLLWRYTTEEEIGVGVVLDGRALGDLQHLLGPVARCVPIRTVLASSQRFVDLLPQIEQAHADAIDWQVYFDEIQDLGLGLHHAYPSLSFEFAAHDRYAAAGCTWQVRRQSVCAARFKVKLACNQVDDQVVAGFHYDPALFTPDTIQRIAAAWTTLLTSVAARPQAQLSRLQMLSEADRTLLLSVSDTATDYPGDLCYHELFERQVERTPNEIAIICEPEQMTYAELNARANQIAHFLRRHGVGPDVQVGLFVERSIEMIAALLGILKAGGAYVPMNPENPKARLMKQLSDIQAPVVVTQSQFTDRLPQFSGTIICLDQHGERIADEPTTNPPRSATLQHLIYVIYTSGSTGIPKGVMLMHSSIRNYIYALGNKLRLWEPDEHRRMHFANVSTIDADLGNTPILLALVSGGCLHLVPYDIATDVHLFAEYTTRHPIDVLKISPSHFHALIAQPEGAAILPSQYLVIGGEPLTRQLIRRMADLGSTCTIINHYGPTETTIGSVTCSITAQTPWSWPSATVPIGGPINNVELYLLDQHLQLVPIGVPGEVYDGGDCLARGYLLQAGQTAERFVPNPFNTGNHPRLYRTGDLARYLPDGQVEFLGRIDFQVKIRGFRVELGEVEAVLRQHPSIRAAVVIAREDSVPTGDGPDKRLVAYLTLREQPAPTVSDLRAFLKDRLPEYMVPSAFVILDELPLTKNGKVDRDALPAPNSRRPNLAAAFVAPRTEVETALAQIWAQVIGLETVGIHDNFFELGGDSILSLQIVARAAQQGVQVTPRDIFDHQTIAELAVVAGTTATPSAEQDLVLGEVPLTPTQQWFFEQQLPEPHHWNMALLLEVRRQLDPELLTVAVEHLLKHHDALRLRLSKTAHGWQQRIDGLEQTVPVRTVDLTHRSSDEQTKAITAEATATQRSLNFETGPLLRVVYFNLGAHQAARLLIVIHHLVVDGVSWRLLLEDFQTAYEQASQGETVALPPKTTSFRQWSHHIHDLARQASLFNGLESWLQRVQQPVPPLPLDYAVAREANLEASAATIEVVLDADETRALLQDVPKVARLQISDRLLAALLRACTDVFDVPALLVEIEGFGRESSDPGIDLSRTVGWFTTHVPVRLELDRAADMGVTLKAIKEQLRVLPHQSIAYELGRYVCHDDPIGAQLAALPQPDITFNYLGQFDQMLPHASLFRLASESYGPLRSPAARRRHLLEVVGGVINGEMVIRILYSTVLHHPTTIEALTASFLDHLRAMMQYCLTAQDLGYTPADFPEANLEQSQLDKLVQRATRPKVNEL